MNQQATAALTREIADAGAGLVRMTRLEPDWAAWFDFSTTGFLRSFFAPALALPFYVVVAAILNSNGGVEPLSGPSLWAAGVGHVLNALAYPAVVALLARPFGFAAGYAAFVVVTNWASLFINMALSLASPLMLLGAFGKALFAPLWMLLFIASVFLIWRASRQTLAPDIAPALLMVVLFIGVGMAADQIALLLIRVVM